MKDPYADPLPLRVTLADAILAVQALESLPLARLEQDEQDAMYRLYQLLHREAYPTLVPLVIT